MSLAEGKVNLNVMGKLWEARKELMLETADCWKERSL